MAGISEAERLAIRAQITANTTALATLYAAVDSAPGNIANTRFPLVIFVSLVRIS